VDAITTWCEHCEEYVTTVTHPWLDAEYDHKTLLWGVYDLETKFHSERDIGITINELRKKQRLAELGVSCIAIWDSDSRETQIYDEHEVEDAVKVLEELDAVVDYNGIRFDRRLLEAILGRETYFSRYVDVLRLIWKSMDGQGIPKGATTLGDVGKNTVGRGKSGKGEDAPKLYKQKKFGSLYRYCMDDVRLTRDVLMHVKEHGWVRNGRGYRINVEAPKWLT
jgi:DEAD/DEAH box helicase domain-containing protein